MADTQALCLLSPERAEDRALFARLRELLLADPFRLGLLRQVEALPLPNCWIGAGLIRNAVWDHLHGRPLSQDVTDIDVIWFDAGRTDKKTESALEAELSRTAPGQNWSVKNQARMHLTNGDAPYTDCADALRHWPETATAVAVRLIGSNLDILAPFGLGDLFQGLLRPTPHFTLSGKQRIFDERVRSKGWLNLWPALRLAS
ncbi:nucleotidyltransferase family protein [Radicibacter daui]|uniref:nucleotidyltransferase family protein n=1 Tax=Radicibacter daui TaxID=3064829 RepID=UPI004046A6C3